MTSGSPVDDPAFERVRAVSARLDELYTAIASKWVQAATTPLTAAVMEQLHPMRASRLMFGSAFNPAMHVVASAAAAIRADRHPLSADFPLKEAETAMFDGVRDALSQWRKTRDDALERLFDAIYGSAVGRGRSKN